MGDYLVHYGVLGMKWGVRHDRPRVGRRRSSRQQPKQNNKRRSRLTDKQKKYLKIGAAVVVTGLAVYGGYKLHENNVLDDRLNTVLSLKRDQDLSIDLNSVNPKQSDAFIDKIIDSDDISGLDLSSEELSVLKKDINDGLYTNCALCTATADMRSRGYDVIAGGTMKGRRRDRLENWYDGAVTYDVNGKERKQTKNLISLVREYNAHKYDTEYTQLNMKIDGVEGDFGKKEWSQPQAKSRAMSVMLNMGDGAHGDISLAGDNSGHSMYFSVNNGKVTIKDYQTGRSFNAESEWFKEKSDYFDKWDFNSVEITRLDNTTPNIKAMIKDGVIRPKR